MLALRAVRGAHDRRVANLKREAIHAVRCTFMAQRRPSDATR